uniref:Uncharacterized protein n=1 Tax=viral metagenome TaxID=1070528 RepID=A0A6C0F5Z7_9ZZZZ
MNITIIFTVLLLALLFSPVEARCRAACRRRRRRARATRAARDQVEKQRAMALQAKYVAESMVVKSISILHSDYYYKTSALFYKPLCEVIVNSFSKQTNKPMLYNAMQNLSQNAKDIIAKNVTDWYTVKIYTKENFPNTYRDENMNITKNFDDVVQYYIEQCYVPPRLSFATFVLVVAMLIGAFFMFAR